MPGLILVAALFAAIAPPARGAEPAPRIDVILWFDTEDYMLPASDDAAKRIAEMLTARQVRATFKVVGEKARVLERRGRQDVIAALRRHAIGYHTDFHSVHPTPTEYLAEAGLLDGMADFTARERQGAADVRRIFGVKTLACYGQPGSSWAPQAVAALRDIGVAPSGVPCYVDEGDHVGLEHQPFWYAGALHVYRMGENWTRMELHEADALGKGRQEFDERADRLARERSGGVISIFYHPCEWVHREFWDGVNFRRGANPPREDWRPPPQRTAAETEAAFERFGAYIDHIRSRPGVRFITAADLPARYPDRARTRGATPEELDTLAQRIVEAKGAGLDFQVLNGKAFSVADQFELLLAAMTRQIAGSGVRSALPTRGLLGPDQAPPPSSPQASWPWPAFRDATLKLQTIVTAERRVPARVFVGTEPVPPLDYLDSLATTYLEWRRTGSPPVGAGVRNRNAGGLLTARYVAEDTPGLFGGWIIHREGFRAPQLMALARLQAWTLKPALRAE